MEIKTKFGIYGGLSNGDGLFDFYSISLNKIRRLYTHPKAFMLMSFLIMNLLEDCYFSNRIENQLYLQFRQIIDLDLTEEETDELLDYLHENELIEFDKLERKSCWLICLI